MSGPAADPPLDFTPVLRFIFTSGFVKQTLKLAVLYLDLCEIPRGAGQYFAMPLLHHDVIFDSNTAYTRNIHTRFYRNHVSRGKLRYLPPRRSGILRNLSSPAIP